MFRYSGFVELEDIGKVKGILLTFKTFCQILRLQKESCSFLAKRLKYSAFVVLVSTQKFCNLSRSEAFQAYIIHNYNRLMVKGQLILKANCQAVNSSKKRMNEFVFTTMRHVFVRFLEEIEDTKKGISKLTDLYMLISKSFVHF